MSIIARFLMNVWCHGNPKEKCIFCIIFLYLCKLFCYTIRFFIFIKVVHKSKLYFLKYFWNQFYLWIQKWQIALIHIQWNQTEFFFFYKSKGFFQENLSNCECFKLVFIDVTDKKDAKNKMLKLIKLLKFSKI